jgi:outer membrane protein, heavy metal efflux system
VSASFPSSTLLLICLLAPGPSVVHGQVPQPASTGGAVQMLALPSQVPLSSSTTPSRPSEAITLPQVVARAQNNSPRLKQAAASVRQAAAATATARVYSNPSVEVFAGEQYARPVATPGVPGLLQHYAAYQTVEVPNERRLRIRSATLTESASRQAQAGFTLSVVAEAKHAFYRVLRQRQEVENTQQNLSLVDDLRRRVKAEVDAGEKGRLELTRAEAEVAQARFNVRRAELELANALALLRIAIAAPPEENLDPQGELDPHLTLPLLPALREEVLRTHPAVAEAQINVQAAEANVAHERALRVPQPTFFSEFENQPDLRFWRAGVTIPLPLWDRRKGRIEGARAGVQEQTAVLDQRRLELISATERAYEAYQIADQQVESLQAGELQSAESAVTAAQAAYRFGERSIVEVLDAQRVLQGVRADLLDAQYERQAALIDLQEVGALPAPEGRP